MINSYEICGKLVMWRISRCWDGYDCGLLSIKKIMNDEGDAAIRIVIWRLALWIEL